MTVKSFHASPCNKVFKFAMRVMLLYSNPTIFFQLSFSYFPLDPDGPFSSEVFAEAYILVEVVTSTLPPVNGTQNPTNKNNS